VSTANLSYVPPSIPTPINKKKGSIIIYDDVEKLTGSLGAITNQSTQNSKYWDSARHYRPPNFSERYKNESDVPPPVVRDKLVIEEFPMGKISTVWINMMKQGLSEWIRVPVIVARGVHEGPVVRIFCF
jgi:hypothetical protein